MQPNFCYASICNRGVVQLVRIHGWGPCGRWFESSRPDHAISKEQSDEVNRMVMHPVLAAVAPTITCTSGESRKYHNTVLMNSEELQKYAAAQSIAKQTIDFLKTYIRTGRTEKEIKEAAEKFLREKGVHSFWYYNIGAFVFVGKRTVISISGKKYQASDEKVQNNDLVTVDLSPQIDNYWGDHARSFVIEDGKVVAEMQSHILEMKEGVQAEQELHRYFQGFITKNTSFEDVFCEMNSKIETMGYRNLDCNHNLGHSIEKDMDKRIYIESGNQKTLADATLFTFEPHIKKKDGNYGFKYEDIYYFDDSSKLCVL